MCPTPDITGLLKRWSDGDEEALDELIPLVYPRLTEIARTHLAGERPGHTLDTQGLVHETYLRLVDIHEVDWNNRVHFISMASRLMRRVLVDHARRRTAEKRGGDRWPVTLDEELLLTDSQVELLLEVDEALTRLDAMHSRQCRVIEQFYFGGMTAKEIAAASGLSRATVQRDLKMARAWLALELGSGLEG